MIGMTRTNEYAGELVRTDLRRLPEIRQLPKTFFESRSHDPVGADTCGSFPAFLTDERCELASLIRVYIRDQERHQIQQCRRSFRHRSKNAASARSSVGTNNDRS
ncbi:hypothetical protein, partial [Thiolapillus sp.]